MHYHSTLLIAVRTRHAPSPLIQSTTTQDFLPINLYPHQKSNFATCLSVSIFVILHKCEIVKEMANFVKEIAFSTN